MNHTDTAIGYLPHNIFVEMNEPCGTVLLQQLADAVESLLSGQIVLATTDQKIMLKEIPSFCGFSGHELVHTETKDKKHHFWIRKG